MPPRAALRRRQPRRLVGLWVAFAAASVATAIAVHRLYETVRRELEEQSAIALAQQHAKARERVQAAAEALRLSTIKALASFHVEGLAHALRQWDETQSSITGTFQWDEGSGFAATSRLPAGLASGDDLPALWREFWAWRVRHPKASARELTTVGARHVLAWHTTNSPAFAPGELGYQGENLDILAYAGKPVDPWAGWAAHGREGAAPWIFWYQAGPGAAVRGCLVDVGPLIARLRGELADRRLARLDVVAIGEAEKAGLRENLDAWLPGFALVAAPGDLFAEKQSGVRLSALLAGSLLGLFLLGAVFLVMFSRRERLDAERKTTFVTQVSHELRTPLTSIRMFADMLAAPELPPEKRARFAGTISRESARLGALIERLLTFNALEQGGGAASVGPVEVTPLVRETLEEMEATLRAAGMRLETEVPSAAMTALTDRSALKQALLNLIENALKYARDGGLVRVTLASAGGMIRLRVADAGPGIPRGLGERAFEPFVQGGRALSDKSPGVGLGLSIARGLLRQAGGDLVLLPSEKGAHFEIRLPHASSS